MLRVPMEAFVTNLLARYQLLDILRPCTPRCNNMSSMIDRGL